MDAYSGKATPLGAAITRQLAEVSISKQSVSQQDNNAYLLTCRATGECLLLDAADNFPAILRLVTAQGRELSAIVTSHQHYDHHRALAELMDAIPQATTYAGAADVPAIEAASGRIIDRHLVHGDTITFGQVSVEVIAIRGHTPGSIALAYTEPRTSDHPGRVHLFTGDSLFPGGVGGTFGPQARADFQQLLADVTARIFARFDDRTWIYPGHGDDTTLGAQRPHLAHWRERGW